MTGKVKYKPRSWSDYNKSLVQRGNLSLWIHDEVIEGWLVPQDHTRGAPRRYSDLAITAMLELKYLLNLTFRATQGFIQSLFELLNIDLPVPDYSTLSRRLRQLKVELNVPKPTESISIAIDSSGLKVYGEGEWKVRVHGHSKRRTWRKFHLGIDTTEQMIHGVTVTTNAFKDSEVFEETVSQVEAPIKEVLGDGAYDSQCCYEICSSRKINPIFPPRKGAVIHQHGNCKQIPKPRDQAIRDIRTLGRKGWKEKVKYHRRSLVETAMFRFKRLFSPSLKSRTFINQAKEVFIKCNILNRFNIMGLARTVPCQ